MRLCRYLYEQTGRPEKVRSIHGMVSVLVGSRVNQQRAWRWLQSQYESGQYVGCISDEEKKPEKPKIARIPAKDFYWSDEWRALRYRRLKDSDGCCCLCGRSRRAHGIVLHVDHIKPRSKHPELELVFENTQVLCEDCNLGKSNRCDRDWR